MEIKSLKLVFFSPTGTTKKVVENIAKRVNVRPTKLIDITKPDSRNNFIETTEDELLIVAVPVYMGRVPALINEWLNNIKALKTPAVCVVVYGNRTFGNALLELKDILAKSGCNVIAGAAFIGEHSFSGSEFPVAKARPDINDLEQAHFFGKKIKEKIQNLHSVEAMSELYIPGDYPYGGVTELWSVDFIAISGKCSNQGICAEVCPTGAIDFNNTKIIDKEKCISCCACIKNCPQNARTIKESKVKEASIRLFNLYKEAKQPVIFY